MVKSSLPRLHQAVIQQDKRLIKELKETSAIGEVDHNGLSALELAQFLGYRECISLLTRPCMKYFNVYLKNKSSPHNMTVRQLEQFFKFSYAESLCFNSYALVETAIANCPYLLRLEAWLSKNDRQEQLYQSQLDKGTCADLSIKWIDSEIGYGVITEKKINKGTCIGEYSGDVHIYTKNQPIPLNSYCFYYPTHFFSNLTLVIDSLRKGNICRFINHHDQPNLQPIWLVKKNILHLVLIAHLDITAGSQLTFNYGKDFWLKRKKINY